MANTATASSVVIDGLAELKAKETELKEKKKLLKAAQERKEWEQKTKQRNNSYVMGSLRSPSDEDQAALAHCHGQVCDIRCEVCGKLRVINKQDAFQVRFCKEHKDEARKAKMKAKRLEKKLAGKSVEDIQAEIEELQSQLETINE